MVKIGQYNKDVPRRYTKKKEGINMEKMIYVVVNGTDSSSSGITK